MIKDIIDANKVINATEIKLKQLKELFPGAFHEDSVDLEYIKNQLKEVKTIKEGYELNFLGKSYAKLLAALDTETVIIPDINHNEKEENVHSDSLFITADNIEALKHLLKSYWRKIKLIYIDPPYNTGSDDFLYKDNFGFSEESLISKLGISEDEARRLIDMTSSGSSSHSAWLTFMYPRLYLSRQLLSENGVIFISIDDHELANLKFVCDEIFGENNFLGNISRATGTTTGQDANKIGSSLDHLLVYQKSDMFSLNRLELDKNDTVRFSLEDSKGKYSLLQMRKTGNADRREDRPSMYYPVTSPTGKSVYPIGPGGYESRWRFGESTFREMLSNDMIVWQKSKSGEDAPYVKYYLEGRTKQVSNLWDDIDGNKKGSLELKELFGDKLFTNPKPTSLIEKIINVSGVGNNDIVLDFFAGSATTAHSVFLANSRDGGTRKFILVQLEEKTSESSEAFKAGYETIDALAKDRIIKSANAISGNGLIQNLKDKGFKHFIIKGIASNQLVKLDTFNPESLISDKGILDEFGIESVLTTWANLDGYGLSRSCSILKLEDYVAYGIDETIYLLNPDISNEAIKALLEKYEDDAFICNKIVLFGYSFTMSEIQSIKDNLKQVEGIRHITLDIIVRY